MKGYFVLILFVFSLLLSGCGTNQNQVISRENKSLSQEKVAVNSGYKVKNLMKKNKLKDKNKQEKNTNQLSGENNVIVEEISNIDNSIKKEKIKNLFKNRYYSESSNHYENSCYFLAYNTFKKDKNGKYKLVYRIYFNKGAGIKSCKLKQIKKIGARWIHNGKKDNIYFLKSYNKEDGTFSYSISEIYDNLKKSELNEYELIFYKKDGSEYKLKFKLDDVKDKNFDLEKKIKEIEKQNKIISDLKSGKYGGYMLDKNTWCFMPKHKNYCLNLNKITFKKLYLDEHGEPTINYVNLNDVNVGGERFPNGELYVYEGSGKNIDKVFFIDKKEFYFIDTIEELYIEKVEKRNNYFIIKSIDETPDYPIGLNANYYDKNGDRITLENNDILQKKISIEGLIYDLKKIGGSSYEVENKLSILSSSMIPIEIYIVNDSGFIGQYELENKGYGNTTSSFYPKGQVVTEGYIEGYIILIGNYKQGLVYDLKLTKKILNKMCLTGEVGCSVLDYSKDGGGVMKSIFTGGTVKKKDLPVFKLTKWRNNKYIVGLVKKYMLSPIGE